jgi:hypothetical protein
MSIDLRDTLRKKYGSHTSTPVETTISPAVYLTAGGAKIPMTKATADAALPNGMALWNAPAALAPERAFVVHAKSGRTVITGPVREIAMANAGFTYLRGRPGARSEHRRWRAAQLAARRPADHRHAHGRLAGRRSGGSRQ